jgi:cation diffusion facilitator CzcD-associated flavoprotein CzcO
MRLRRGTARAPSARGEPAAVVVGAGAAGLGAAASLERRGVPTLVLERYDDVGASWRRRCAGVRLNTVRWMSGLPRMPIPRAHGPWPTRDAFVDYLEDYARRNALRVRTNVAVERIDPVGSGYRLATSAGAIDARVVVVATGFNHTPSTPDWPGLDGFAGAFLHASAYRDPAPFADRDVLIVGLGNTGSELAVELLGGGARRVRVSMRTPPNILRRSNFGVPATVIGRLGEYGPAIVPDRLGMVLQRLLWGDLTRYGLPPAPYGIATEIERKGLGPVVDDGFVALLRRGRVELVPPVERFEGPAVALRGGRQVRPDVVIAATGYSFGLGPLVGHLGVLSPSGRPLVSGAATHPAHPQLYFNGYHAPLRGQLPSMSGTSRQIAAAVVRSGACQA